MTPLEREVLRDMLDAPIGIGGRMWLTPSNDDDRRAFEVLVGLGLAIGNPDAGVGGFRAALGAGEALRRGGGGPDGSR